MKQQIICPVCAADSRKTFLTDNPFPGEHLKFINGSAKRPFICDLCGTKIDKNANCVAYSIWADRSPAGYYEWEHEFITELFTTEFPS